MPSGAPMADAETARRIRLLPAIACAAALLLATRIVNLWDSMVIAAEPAASTPHAKDEKSASAAPKPAPEAKTTEPAKTAPAKPAAENATRSFDPAAATEAEIDVLQRLSARRDELERRARDIDAREALLKAAEQRH